MVRWVRKFILAFSLMDSLPGVMEAGNKFIRVVRMETQPDSRAFKAAREFELAITEFLHEFEAVMRNE